MITFSWEPVDYAISYRVYQVADGSMSFIEESESVSLQCDISKTDLEANSYFVVGVNWVGEEGFHSDYIKCIDSPACKSLLSNNPPARVRNLRLW